MDIIDTINQYLDYSLVVFYAAFVMVVIYWLFRK